MHATIEQRSVLVTGGAGFIGSHIVEYLLAHGAKKVRVLDNLMTGLPGNVERFKGHPNYEFLEGDMRDASTCLRATEGMDYISHQAALGSVPRSIKDPATTNAINVNGFVNVMSAARENGVQRVVYASSSSVYGDEKTLPKVESKIGQPLSPYAVSKLAGELYQKVFHDVYGQQIIGLRYFNIFGPRQDPNGPYAAVIPRFIDRLRKGEPVFIDGDGSQTRDFTYIDNAVQANIKALTTAHPDAPGKVFNIAVGKRYSVLDLFETLVELMGLDAAPEHRDSRPGDVRDSLADIGLAQSLLGYEPSVHFKEGLRRTLCSMGVQLGDASAPLNASSAESHKG